MVYKSLACQYNQVNDAQYFIEQVGGKTIAQKFTEQVILTLAIPRQQEKTLRQQLLM